MNRLAIIAVTGALALLLTACGERGSSKPNEDKTPAEQTNEVKSNEAAPAQQEATPAQQEATPAEAQPATETEKH